MEPCKGSLRLGALGFIYLLQPSNFLTIFLEPHGNPKAHSRTPFGRC